MIDALDGYERDEDIQVILQLLARARDASVVRLRILVMGRPELPICLGFKKKWQEARTRTLFPISF